MIFLYSGAQALYVIEHTLLILCAVIYVVTAVFDRYD